MNDEELERRISPDLKAAFRDLGPVDRVPNLTTPGTEPATITITDAHVEDDVPVRHYHVEGVNRGRRILFVHGGGFTAGTLSQFDAQCSFYARETGATVTSVGYRLAPAARHPQILADTAAAWRDVHGGAERTAIVGSSAGAAIAAGLALSLRDTDGVLPDLLLLHAPVLDDRHTSVSSRQFTHPRLFHRNASRRAWAAYLGNDGDPPATAAPARAEHLDGFPPTFLALGDLEVARDEALEFARRLAGAGVPVELHLYPGAYHGFDVMAPDAGLSRESLAAQVSALRRALG